jgi:hypothetical protein
VRSVQFQSIREDVRVRYALPTFSSTTSVTTTMINRLINQSLQAFYAMLVECYGENYFLTNTTLTTTASQGYTSLPTDCIKLKKLMWLKSSTEVIDIDPSPAPELYRTSRPAEAWATPRFILAQQSIYWVPVPNAAYSVACWYVQQPADLSGDTDTFQAGPNWDEWVVADVCYRLAQSEKRPVEERVKWQQDRDAAEARIKTQAPERDETNAHQIQNVRYPYDRMGDRERRDWITYGMWFR